MNIHKTTDYEQFKLLPHGLNRTVKGVDQIKVSLKHRDMLKIHPIHVNSEMQIIDGQTRFLAAKELKKPIYYIIDDDASLNDLPFLQISRKWIGEDYVNHYSARDYDDYKFIKLLHENYKLSYDNLLFIVSKYSGWKNDKTVLHKFRRGAVELRGSKEKLEDDVSKISELFNAIKIFVAKPTRSVIRALVKMVRLEGYRHAHFLERVNINRQEVITACDLASPDSVFEYFKKFVYNKSLKSARI